MIIQFMQICKETENLNQDFLFKYHQFTGKDLKIKPYLLFFFLGEYMPPCIFDNQLGYKISHLLSYTLTAWWILEKGKESSTWSSRWQYHSLMTPFFWFLGRRGGSISLARACKPTMVCVSGESIKGQENFHDAMLSKANKYNYSHPKKQDLKPWWWSRRLKFFCKIKDIWSHPHPLK